MARKIACGLGRRLAVSLVTGLLGAGVSAAAMAGLSVAALSVAAPDRAAAASPQPAFPRFASLKVDRVTVRQGPGAEHAVLWTFQRIGLPVEILREQGAWVEIRDNEGGTGWTLKSLVSGRRTVLITASGGRPPATTVLRRHTSSSAPVEAELEAGLIAAVLGCDGLWCRLSVGQAKGWVEQSGLWGVYAGEQVRP